MTILCGIGLAWSVLGLALASLTRGDPRPARRAFSLVILVFSWPLAMTLLSGSPAAGGAASSILLHVQAVPFLFGPALYLYARSIMRLKPGSRWVFAVHAIPFITLNALDLAGAGLFSPGPWPPASGLMPNPVARLILGLCNAFSVVAYGLAARRLIRRYRHDAGNYYSSGLGKYTLSWLENLSNAYLVAFSVSILFLCAVPLLPGFRFFRPELAINGSIGAFLFFFVLLAHDQGVLAVYDGQGKPSGPDDPGIPPVQGSGATGETSLSGSKYSRSTLDEDAVKSLFSELESFMEGRKPWLDPELDLDGLARSLGYSRHEVSQAINSLTEGNFYSYVNGYRVNAFLKAIGEGLHGRYSFASIAFDCGFNSQSAFYAAVKRQTGATPKELVRSLSASPAKRA